LAAAVFEQLAWVDAFEPLASAEAFARREWGVESVEQQLDAEMSATPTTGDRIALWRLRARTRRSSAVVGRDAHCGAEIPRKHRRA
jgi:hypothetical protein